MARAARDFRVCWGRHLLPALPDFGPEQPESAWWFDFFRSWTSVDAPPAIARAPGTLPGGLSGRRRPVGVCAVRSCTRALAGSRSHRGQPRSQLERAESGARRATRRLMPVHMPLPPRSNADPQTAFILQNTMLAEAILSSQVRASCSLAESGLSPRSTAQVLLDFLGAARRRATPPSYISLLESAFEVRCLLPQRSTGSAKLLARVGSCS